MRIAFCAEFPLEADRVVGGIEEGGDEVLGRAGGGAATEDSK